MPRATNGSDWLKGKTREALNALPAPPEALVYLRSLVGVRVSIYWFVKEVTLDNRYPWREATQVEAQMLNALAEAEK